MLNEQRWFVDTSRWTLSVLSVALALTVGVCAWKYKVGRNEQMVEVWDFEWRRLSHRCAVHCGKCRSKVMGASRRENHHGGPEILYASSFDIIIFFHSYRFFMQDQSECINYTQTLSLNSATHTHENYRWGKIKKQQSPVKNFKWGIVMLLKIFLPMRLCICSPSCFLSGIKGSDIRSQTEQEKNMKGKRKRGGCEPVCLKPEVHVCTLMLLWHSRETEDIATVFYKTHSQIFLLCMKQFICCFSHWADILKWWKCSLHQRNDLMDESI